MKNTERLLLEIGLRPSRRGFAQSAMLLCILRDRPEIRSVPPPTPSRRSGSSPRRGSWNTTCA